MRYVTVFSESRIVRDGSSCVFFSRDPNLQGNSWARGLEGTPNLRAAVRVQRVADVSGLSRVSGPVFELPYYVGSRQLFRTFPRLCWSIWRGVKSSRVIVVRLPGVVGTIASVMALVLGRAFAVDLAGDIDDVARSGALGKLGRLRAVMSAGTRGIVKRAAAVRYVTRETLQRKYPAGSSAASIGYSAVRLPDDWLVPEANPGLPGSQPTVCAIGSHEQLYKGHDDLIRVIARLREDGFDVGLVLVGEGRRQPELVSLASSLGVADLVRFAGHVGDRAVLANILDDAHVYAQPSRTEGLPRALVEAMGRGKACVGTSVGGIPELLEEEFLTSPGDIAGLASVIKRLLVDSKLRMGAGQRNLRLATEFRTEALQASNDEWRRIVGALLPSELLGARVSAGPLQRVSSRPRVRISSKVRRQEATGCEERE